MIFGRNWTLQTQPSAGGPVRTLCYNQLTVACSLQNYVNYVKTTYSHVFETCQHEGKC